MKPRQECTVSCFLGLCRTTTPFRRLVLKVCAGAVLAGKVDGCHIHFHLMIDGRNGFLAPAIFDAKTVKDFHDKCSGFRWSNDGKAIPPCMGNRIGAKENPFGTGPKKQL